MLLTRNDASHLSDDAPAAVEAPVLDPRRCYRALLARDARFDGRFFTGVKTTGIYCRPVCPARTPKFENVRFFACAAAAEAAGFRPCLRCRPETAPGTPAWIGSSATVSRALRLIADGALDDGDPNALAARLGVGERHLRRLFHAHLGASPAAIARARRVHFARRLLDETALRVGDVALSAGFGSIRQFNDAMRATFKMPPTALRRRRGSVSAAEAGLGVRLAYRPPLDWRAMLGFLAARAIPGVERVDGAVYRRTIEVDGVTGVLALECDTGGAWIRLRVDLPRTDRLIAVVARARRIFDLDADPLPIAAQLRRCPVLGPRVVAAPGLRVPGAWDPFELAVRAVLGQQVTVRGATTLAGRLAAAFGRPVAGPDGLDRLFPVPAVLADAALEEIGLPRARAATVRALAAAVAGGTIALDGAADLEVTVARLAALPGVGSWTAQYVAMRALGEPDAFPDGDLGLRRALARGGTPAPARRIAALADGWRPWRAYAAMHLWHAPTAPARAVPAPRRASRPRAQEAV